VKLPYIKWYFRDAAADLRLLDAVPRCVWYEMLWLMAAADRYGYLEWAGHPMTDIEIARASGLTADEIAAARPVLIAAGIPSVDPETGAWFCRRMVDDEARRQKAIEDGKRGGNPSLASLPVATELLQNPEPRTHISLTPPLTPTLKGQGKGRVGKSGFGAVAVPEPPFTSEAFAAAWSDWVQFRKEIKKPLTPTMIKAQFKDFAEKGEERSIAMIRHTIRRGWWGLREEDGGNSGHPQFSPKRPTQAGAPQSLEGNSTIDGIHKFVPGGEGW